MIYISLIHNIALLITLAFIHSLMIRRIRGGGIAYPLLSGLLFGCVCVIVMMSPVKLQPGLIFDGRSIILSVAGLFCGPLAALIAATIASAYRFLLGGIGALPGIGVIVGATGLGVAWHYLRRRQQWAMKTPALYLFGLLVHILMLAILILLLPGPAAQVVISNISLPVLLLYPPATLLICLFFQMMEQHIHGEEALRQSEKRMRLFFERQLVGMAITTPEKGWVQVNDKLCQMLGYSREELALLSWLDLTHPDDMALDLAKFKCLMSGEIDEYSIEKRFIHKGGAIVHTNLSVGCVRCPDGSVDYVLALLEDITERKQADKALRFSEEKFSKAFHLSPDAIIINRLSDGIYLDVNKGFTVTTGYSAEEVIGKSPIDLNIWVNVEERAGLLRELKEHGSVYSFEAQFMKKDGSIASGLISSSLMEVNGELCILSIARDITEQRLMQEDRLKSQKLESLGILAGGIAHDFNNILTGIMGNISFAQIFLDAAHKSYKPLVEAEKASVRATELAQQLLTFARGGEPIKKLVSLRKLLNESVSLMLHGSNVKVTIDVQDTIHAVEADDGQLSQVFHNIIINAKQAMPGGGTLTVTAQNETLGNNNTLSLPPGTYVCLTFTDQGCGIPDDDLKRIFDPYFTTKAAGNGLGLASAHSIVSRHGGHIGVSSEVGKGTVFTIHLPSIGEAYAKYQTDTVTNAIGDHAGGSILVMDDEKMIRDMMTEILEYLGYQVATCENGGEAIKLYKAAWESRAPFSAVVLDLTIPGGIGGKEAAQHILDIDTKACMIVSSGYSSDPIMSDYSTYGFKGAMAKPFSTMEIGKLLGSLLSKQMN